MSENTNEKWKKGIFDYVRCSCSSEILFIELFDNDPTEQDAYLFILTYYLRERITWKDRIRYCWKVLRTGKPYSDQVCLGVDEIRKLASIANETADIIEARKEEINSRISKST